MSINDPILEALTFTLENDLNILTPPPKLTSGSAVAADSITDSACSGIPLKSKSSNSKSRDAEGCDGSNDDFIRSAVLFGEEGETLCPIHTCSFTSEKNLCSDKTHQGEFLTHLLNEHNLIIENVDEIANLKMYLKHWRDRFSTAPLSEFCVGFKMDAPPKPPEIRRKTKKSELDKTGEDKPSDEGKEETKTTISKENSLFYMLSPALPEDKQLRKDLWKRRLDVVIEANRSEREDNSFSRRCLFCRDVITGNRSQYFFHMRDSHSFHIGQPDNLVFVKEFMQFLEEKLNRLECLFCECLFKDKVVLKEHMRKKQHRKINPKNHDYDKFYVVNYLEPGKTWETLELEDAEDERKEDEWMEPTDEKQKSVVCLFCKHADSDFHKIICHMKSSHQFDFMSITSSFDFYQKIKLVNFIRRTVYQNACFYCEGRFEEPDQLQQHILEHSVNGTLDALPDSEQWSRPEYFFPTYEDDDFLTCLGPDDDDDADKRTRQNSISSEDSYVIPEDLPQLDMRNRDFDLAGFAIRYHSNSSSHISND